jgi:DNA-binding XRE family transcriptional regulator
VLPPSASSPTVIPAGHRRTSGDPSTSIGVAQRGGVAQRAGKRTRVQRVAHAAGSHIVGGGAPDAIDEYIGARMRERRVEPSITQSRLADELGVSFQQVQKYEKGINRISASRLFDICKILNVSLSSMFEHDPNA